MGETTSQHMTTSARRGRRGRLRAFLVVLLACVLAIAGFAAWFVYETRYRVAQVDAQTSPDGAYEVVLQAVGEPEWPFGKTPGRLLLKSGDETVSRHDFKIADDGAILGQQSWSVEWNADAVTVTLTGSEQYPEVVRLTYGGGVVVKVLEEEPEDDAGSDSAADADAAADAEPDPTPEQAEQQLREARIREGYAAVYHEAFSDGGYTYVERRDAKDNLQVIVREDDEAAELLVHDRESANGACDLYVWWRAEKASDGTWSMGDAQMLGSFAWATETGEIVASGKTSYADAGTQQYHDLAGEW